LGDALPEAGKEGRIPMGRKLQEATSHVKKDPAADLYDTFHKKIEVKAPPQGKTSPPKNRKEANM